LNSKNINYIFSSILVGLFLISQVLASNLPVYVEDDIYDFLERMESREIISGYSGLALPLNRAEIAQFLNQIDQSSAQLNQIEKKIYRQIRSEYYLELRNEKEQESGTRIKFINTGSPAQTFKKIWTIDPDQKEQHLLKYESEKGFIWGDMDFNAQNQTRNDLNRQVLGNQVLLRGGLNEKLSGYLQFDSYLKMNAGEFDELLPEEKGRLINEDVFFSNAYAGLTYSNKIFSTGLYQQPLLWGASRENNLTFSNNGPPFPYFRFSTEIGWLKYSLVHGGLVNDSTSHKFRNVDPDIRDMPKNVAAQRFEISLFQGHTYLGINEMVIYSNRTLEWSYVVPFNFYFAAEHYLEDRDNTLLSFDIKSKIFKNTQAYATFFFDELKWSKLVSEWWGNKQAVQLGVRNHSYLGNFPFDLQVEYTAVRPWTYTHKYFNNNYTNDRYGLGFPYGPNSQLFYLEGQISLSYRLKLFLEYNYLQQGQNTEETIFGSQATDNYELRDPEYDNSTGWLMGDILTRNQIEFGARFEYINNCFLYGSLQYRTDATSSENNTYLYSTLGASINF